MPDAEVFLIAAALAMDAFAVATAAGVRLKRVGFGEMFRLSWHFGLFQALMPVIGWSLGYGVKTCVETLDHWIAFGLLALVGLNMIREVFEKENQEDALKDPTRGMLLVILSVATSIDALAVGLSFSIMQKPILVPACIIGFTALMFTVAGLQIGRRLGRLAIVGKSAEMLGGVVLILIGLNILREHGVFLK